MSTEIPFMFEITKTPDGGYVVTDSPRMDHFRSIRFASTTIDEAFKYLRSKFEPRAAK